MRLLLCCGLLVACHAQPAGGTLHGAPGRTVEPPAAATHYESEAPDGVAVSGPYRDAVQRAMAEASSTHTMRLAPDPRLMQLAAWIAQQMQPSQATPAQRATDLATRALGLLEPTPHFIVLAASDSRALPDRLTTEVSKLLARHAYTHYGASTRATGGVHVVVIALSFRFIDLQPVPRAVSVGTPLVLQGTLTHAHANPEVAVTRPDGQVERQHEGSGPGVACRVETKAAGVYRVEVLAQGPQGITVVANFPVYVGVPVPGRIELPQASPDPTAAGTETAAMLAMLNAERTRAGVAALVLDPALGAVARAHVDDMIAHGFIAHTSPTTGSAVDRVARAGIRTPVVLENIGRGYSLSEVHAGLMGSPGHRANVLHPQATHVGIAVGTEHDHDATAYVVTQVFSRVTPPLPEDSADALLERVNALRDGHGARALRQDEAMQAIAGRAATRYCKANAPTEAEIMREVHTQLARQKTVPRRVSAVLTIVYSLDDLARLDALLAPGLLSLGLGLAQGSRPDTFPNAICALLLLGE